MGKYNTNLYKITPREERYLNRLKMKKAQENTIDWQLMISPSSIRNAMINDHLVDYLKIKYKNPGIKDIFLEHIFKLGTDHEKSLISYLKQYHTIKTVATHYTDAKNINKMNETINMMKSGADIIYQAVLIDHNNGLFGMPDLLVRSTYVNTLMGYEVLSPEELKLGSPKLNTPWYYIVIDIKCSTIPLKCDGIMISNTGNMMAYKGQLYIYNTILNNIMGLNNMKAYIWGGSYEYTKEKVTYKLTNFLNKLGTVNYNDSDKCYIDKTLNAIKWVRELRKNGHKWKLLPTPSKFELYPNMTVQSESFYMKKKIELAKILDEITLIWNCGIEERKKAHQNNIFRWNDIKLNSNVMGINGTNATIIDNILDINRQTILLILSPESICKEDNNVIEFALDFETINIKSNDLLVNNYTEYVYLIGIYYYSNNKGIYKEFLLEETTKASEYNMFQEFYTYINTLLNQYNKKNAKFYHWSHAEVSSYNRFKAKHFPTVFFDTNYIFYDLLTEVFIKEKVVVKGAFTYSLKSIAKALYNTNLIKSVWEDSKCSNGMDAMVLAIELYDTNKAKRDNMIMQDIIKYNMIDCKVVLEILHLCRSLV